VETYAGQLQARVASATRDLDTARAAVSQKDRDSISGMLADYRRLAKDAPADYGPELAQALRTSAVYYRNLRLSTEADAAFADGIKLARELVRDDPDRYSPVLASTLNAAALADRNSGRITQAEIKYSEALSIWRQLSKTHKPDIYALDVAATLMNLGNVYQGTQDGSAERQYMEALGIVSPLAKPGRTRAQILLAELSNNLGAVYQRTQRPTEAVKALTEAIRLRTELAKADAKEYGDDLAAALLALAAVQQNQDKSTAGTSGACALATEAVQAAVSSAAKTEAATSRDRFCK
jgi:tetratricopeptide (TPR) repeat protein